MGLFGGGDDLIATLGIDASSFEAGVEGINAKLGGLKGVLGATGVLAAAAFAGKAVADAAEYEKSLHLIENRARTAAPPLAELSEQVASLARNQLDNAFSQREVATALAEVVSEARDVAEAQELLAASGKLAVVVGEELGETAGFVADLLSAYNLPVAQATRVTDALYVASKQTGTGLNDLARMLVEVAPQARALGLDFGDLVATAGVLADAGVENLKAFFAAWLEAGESLETSKAARFFNSFSVNVTTADGKLRPILDVLADLRTRIDDTGTSSEVVGRRIVEAFGDKQGRAVLALVQNLDTARGTMDAVRDSTGATAQAFDGTVTTVTTASNRFNDLTTQLGERLLPVVNVVLDALVTGIDAAAPVIASAFDFSPLVESVERAKREFPAFVESVSRFGADLVAGLQRGITSTADAVVASVRNLGGNVIAAFKNVLGIASPSVVFREIGRDVMAGFGLGIRIGGDVPRAEMETVLGGMVTKAGGYRDQFFNAGVLAAKGLLSGVQVGLVATGEAVVDAFGNIVFDRNKIQGLLAHIVEAYAHEIQQIASPGGNFQGIFFNPNAIAQSLQTGQSAIGVSGAGLYVGGANDPKRAQIFELIRPVFELAQRIAAHETEIKEAVLPGTNLEGIFFNPAAIARAIIENQNAEGISGAGLFLQNSTMRNRILEIAGARQVGTTVVFENVTVHANDQAGGQAAADAFTRELARLGVTG